MTPHVFPRFERLLRRGPSTIFTGFPPAVVGRTEKPQAHKMLQRLLDHYRRWLDSVLPVVVVVVAVEPASVVEAEESCYVAMVMG